MLFIGAVECSVILKRDVIFLLTHDKAPFAALFLYQTVYIIDLQGLFLFLS